MASITQGQAKELLPIANEPVLGHVLRECAQSGMTDVLIITSPGKNTIVEYAQPLAGTVGFPQRIEFIVQHDARGLADAIRLGKPFSDDLPIAVALPDNLFAGPRPALMEVKDAYARTGKNVVGVAAITASQAPFRGPTAAYPGTPMGDLFYIERIPDKGAKTTTFDTLGAKVAYTGVGRYVFTPDAFEVIDAIEKTLTPDAELDDIPLLQRLLEADHLVGRILDGHFFDVGLPQGYLDAAETYSSTMNSLE